jgi:hypothetical protein
MNRYWSGLVVAGVFAAAVGLGAQAQNPANTPPPDAAAQPGSQRTPAAPAAQTRTPNSVTLSGCIQAAPMTAASGASVSPQGQAAERAGAGAATRAAEQQFVLNSARMTASGDASRGPVGTTGSNATSYRLEGDTATISPHLNQQVEITGTIQASAASPTGTERSAPGSTASGPTLRVTSVKMMSATCSSPSSTPGTTGQTTPRDESPRPDPQPEQQPQPEQAPAPPPRP